MCIRDRVRCGWAPVGYSIYPSNVITWGFHGAVARYCADFELSQLISKITSISLTAKTYQNGTEQSKNSEYKLNLILKGAFFNRSTPVNVTHEEKRINEQSDANKKMDARKLSTYSSAVQACKGVRKIEGCPRPTLEENPDVRKECGVRDGEDLCANDDPDSDISWEVKVTK